MIKYNLVLLGCFPVLCNPGNQANKLAPLKKEKRVYGILQAQNPGGFKTVNAPSWCGKGVGTSPR